MNTDHCRRFRMLIPLAVIAFVGLLSFAVYSLWNGVLAEVIGVKTITYWQALGLLVYLESLDPEQREHIREEMRHRFGAWPRPPWCGDSKSSADDKKTPEA
jgi:hypothetical protein